MDIENRIQAALDKHKFMIHRGNCLNLLKQMPPNSVDAVIADPPYGTTALAWDQVIPFEEMWPLLWRVVKPNSPIILFCAQPFTSRLIISQEKYHKYNYVWVKNTQTGISLSRTQPMRKHEDIAVFYRKQPTYNKQMQVSESDIMHEHVKRGYGRGEKPYTSEHLPNMNLYRTKFTTLINPSTVLKFNSISNRSKSKFHPTQKPVDLLEYFVATYTNPNDVVLDFSAGSFSTGEACLNLGRRFIGSELEHYYAEQGLKRLREINSNAMGAAKRLP